MKTKQKKKRGRPRKLKSIVKRDLSGDKAYLINNFIDLNPNYISEHPEVKSLVAHVYQEMVDNGLVILRKHTIINYVIIFVWLC